MMRALEMACRIVFATAFVLAGAAKMFDAAGFATVISHYQLLPAKMIYGAALILPAVELVCGLALLCGVLMRGALALLNALMAGFLAAMILSMVRGLDVTCGCFGGAGQSVDGQTLARDAVLLVIGLIAAWGAFHRAKAQGTPPPGS